MTRISKTHRYIDLSILPKKGKSIDWKNSIGYKVYFEYKNIKGYIEILDCVKIKEDNYLRIKYNENEIQIYTGNLKKVYLGKLLGCITNEFKIEINTQIKDKKRNLIIIDGKRKNRKRNDSKNEVQKMYKYRCYDCGYEGWIEESNLLKGKGCACCCTPPRVIVKGINDIATTDPWMVEYLVNKEDGYKYSFGSLKKINVRCPDCGRIKKSTMNDLYKFRSVRCICGDGFSYPNKFMFNLLEQLNIDFKTEYYPKWSNRRFYDFYDKENNIIIEMDGGLGHGYNDNLLNGVTKEKSKEVDKLKDLAAQNQGIKVIRINCDYNKVENRHEYIKNNTMISELKNYYDFEKVNWNEVDKFATSNLVKKVCEYYECHKNTSSIKDIASKFKISTCTLKTYLKNGNKFKWCEYHPSTIKKSA